MSDYGGEEDHHDEVEVIEEGSHHSDYSHHSGGVDVVIEHGTPHDDGATIIVVEESEGHGGRNVGAGVFICICILIIIIVALLPGCDPKKDVCPRPRKVKVTIVRYFKDRYTYSARSSRDEATAFDTTVNWKVYRNMRPTDIAGGGGQLWAI